MSLNNPIKFQGSAFTFPVLYIKHHTINIVKDAILKKIKESPIFFKNSYIILNVSYLTQEINWYDMQQTIISTGLRIIGICGNINHILKNSIVKSGLPIFINKKNILNNTHHFKNNSVFDSEFLQTKIVTKPVRSGQKIHAYQSDLIIINNVSSGAELISSGNIHIYGTMRGRALAGVYGDTKKKIFCTKFFAEIVSIAGEYLLIDEVSPYLLGRGVYVCSKKNILHVNTF